MAKRLRYSLPKGVRGALGHNIMHVTLIFLFVHALIPHHTTVGQTKPDFTQGRNMKGYPTVGQQHHPLLPLNILFHPKFFNDLSFKV